MDLLTTANAVDRETKTKTSKRVDVLVLWWHHKTTESKKLKKRNKKQIMESVTTYVTTCQTVKYEYELFSNCRTVLSCALCMFKICFSLSIFFRARTRNGNRAIYSQFIVKVWGGEQQADYINIKLGQRQYNDCKYYMFVCRYNLSKIKNTKQFSCWMIWLGTQSPKWNVCCVALLRLFDSFFSLRRAQNTKAKRYELFNNVRTHTHSLCL